MKFCRGSRGNPKGARRPPLVVSIGEVRRRGRKRNLPLLRVVFFASFLLDKQKKGRIVRLHFSWLSAHAFPSAEHSAAKERRPMVGATLAELPGSIRTATAHSAKALFPVMLFPLAALAQWEVGSSISKYTQKSRYPNGYLLFRL